MPRKKKVVKSSKKVTKKRISKTKVTSVAREDLDDHEGMLIRRLSDCERVVNELETTTAWKVLQADMEIQRQMLDDNWQEITEPEKLQKARELKNATLHLLRLKDKYEEELNDIKSQLEQLRNPDKVVAKDYDPE